MWDTERLPPAASFLLVLYLLQIHVQVFCFVFATVLVGPRGGSADHQLELELPGEMVRGEHSGLQRQPVVLHLAPDLAEILEDDRQPPEVNTVRRQPLLEDTDIEA